MGIAVEKITLREGTTTGIPVILYADNLPIDLSNIDYVRWDMVDSSAKTYRYASNDVPAYVEITNPVAGEVTFTPPNENIFKYRSSPYRLYIWVYDSNGKRYSVPEKDYAEIVVEKEY